MKTLKKINKGETDYRRVNDTDATSMVKSGWSYCSKTEWKTNVRDFGKEKVEKKETPSGSQDKIYNKKNAKGNNEKTVS